MPFWVVGIETYRNGDPKLVCNKVPYSMELQAQKYLDSHSKTGRLEIYQTKARNWPRASQEIKAQIGDRSHSMKAGTERIYKPVSRAEGSTSTTRTRVKKTPEDEEGLLRRKRLDRAVAAGRRSPKKRTKFSRESRLSIA